MDGYTLQLASDVLERDGLGVELYSPSRIRIAEVFRDDTTGDRTFRNFVPLELPPAVLQWLSIFVRAIVRAAKTYAEPIEAGEWWDRPAVPFHVVLQADPADAAAARARWLAAGAQVSDFIS